MSVKSVKLDNATKSVGRRNTIEIGRGVGKVELMPEVINYTIQDPYVGYWLEGFDADWTIMPQSSLGAITYTNLPTGTYTFHLAVFDNNKGNILGERDYTLVKAREIYDYPWFVGYIVFVPMVAVIWATWYSMRRRMQRLLERQEREMALMKQQLQMGNETIMAIAKTVDAKDGRTSRHSQRVSQYSMMIGRELGFDEKECENLRRAALMHDIGKIGIPDDILNKPDRLTDEEYAIMKTHVTHGAEILKDFTLIEHVVDGARYHHERYDGRGYPDGLKGEEIPLYGRIIGVADAFDAMTANRVYRKKMDFGYVFNEMKNGKGTQFDPQIVDILLRLIDEGKIDLNALYQVKKDDD
jgi:energy-coupling factor transport system substrate-specific component